MINNVLTKKVGQVMIAVVLAVVALGFLGATSTPSAAAPVAPSDTIGRAPKKVSNVHDKRMKPYKYEHNVRYTSNSTKMPSTAPCAVLGSNPANWPAGVYSCYGPPAAKAKQAPPAKKPAAKKPAAKRPATRPAAAPRNSGGGSSGSQNQYPPSCG